MFLQMKDHTKRVLSLFVMTIMIVTNGYSLTNPLVNPASGTGIIDVGYNGEKAPYAANIPQDFFNIPALSRDIDNNIIIKPREHESFSCQADDYGFEVCPEEQSECNGNLETDRGVAVEKNGYHYVSKVTTTVNNPYHLSNGASPSPSGWGGLLSPYNIGVGDYEYKFKVETAGVHTFKMQADNYMTIRVNGNIIHTDTSDNWQTIYSKQLTLATGEHTIRIVAGNYAGPHGVAVTIEQPNGVMIWNTRNGQGPATITTTVCPADSTDTALGCKKDYKYFDYQCSNVDTDTSISWDDSNPGGSWVGPLNPGGDCSGIGLSAAGYCNSGTPPADNCLRTSYVCPVDSNSTCTKVASNNSLAENLFEGFIFNQGEATLHTDTIVKEKSCIGSGVYNPTKDICEATLEYGCLTAGFEYDAEANECLGDYSCPGYWNELESKCEVEPNVECPSGYNYDSISMRCEATPECSSGATFNSNTFECELTAECDTAGGWERDETTGECTKPLETVDPVCAESFMEWQRGEGICDGYADFREWTSVDPWGTGNWTTTNGGNTLYQTVNGNYPTFYLSQSNYPATLLKGKVKTTDNDDDSFGIIFGYQSSTNYFMTNWTQGGWTKGSHNLSIQKSRGNASNYALGGVTYAGHSGKWSKGVWHEIEVRANSGTVEVYIDGTFRAKAENLNLPDNGRIGFFNQSQANVYYKDFYIATEPICIAGFTYDKDRDSCYKNLSGYTVDLENGVYRDSPICPTNATYDSETKLCTFAPSCLSNGTIDTIEEVCFKEETISCVGNLLPSSGISYETCSDTAACEADPITCSTCRNIHIDGYDQVCATSDVCPAGTTAYTFNGETKCKTDKQLICPSGYSFEESTNTCLSSAECKVGYVERNGSCELTYNWATYTCPSDYQGPLETGADCNGECNSDGCWCNPSNPPVNNCKKAFTLNSGGETFEMTERRTLGFHTVTGNRLSEEDFGELKDFDCGENCLFNVDKIVGNEDNLCFTKKNGESSCFQVDGCYFEGEIEPNTQSPNGEISKLTLIDSHTLRSNFETKLNDNGEPTECRIGSYNSVTKSCEGTMPMSSWSVEGNPSSGNWTLRVMDGEEEFYQANNLLNTMYMYPTPLMSKYTIKGQINPRVNHKNSIGLVFGWESDSSMYLIDWGSKSYWCRSYGNCGLDLNGMSYGALNLIKVNSSAEAYGTYMRNDSELLATNLDPDWTAGAWQDIKAEIDGGNIKVYLGGTKYLDYTLPNGEIFPEGKVGFFNLSTPGVSYRRFYVEDMQPDCPTGTFLDAEANKCRVYECDEGWTVDYSAEACTKSITSSCRMNGHVGWTGRTEGITSVGAGATKTKYVILTAEGTASYDSNSYWEGFNIGTMAIKLSDGFWYASSTFKDASGNTIQRNLPSYIKELGTSFYQITEGANIGLDCKYNGVNTPDYCGTELKIILPGTKMELLAVSDIGTLIGGDSASDNQFNLDLTIKGIGYEYKGTGAIENLEFTDGEATSETDIQVEEQILDRINFWDSFRDGELGFIEFIREVKNVDRAENFVPENPLPYDLAASGVTSIDYVEGVTKTIFVKPTVTTAAECSDLATRIGGSVLNIESWTESSKPLARSMGAGELGACTVIKNENDSFGIQEFAIRKNIYEGDYAWKCSPYTCESHKCEIATCPIEMIGGSDLQNGVSGTAVEVEYMGTKLPDYLIPDNLDPNVITCLEQVCDANKEYVDFCGRDFGCDLSNDSITQTEAGDCKEFYCTEGTFDPDTKSCVVKMCPPNTTENANGECERN